MAMTKCRECGKEVSTQASKCLHCGVGNPGRPLGLSSGALGCLAVLGVVAVVVVVGLIGGSSGSSSSREVALDPQEAKGLAASRHRRRQQADSQLAGLSQAQILQLKDSVLLFLARWSARATSAAYHALAERHHLGYGETAAAEGPRHASQPLATSFGTSHGGAR